MPSMTDPIPLYALDRLRPMLAPFVKNNEGVVDNEAAAAFFKSRRAPAKLTNPETGLAESAMEHFWRMARIDGVPWEDPSSMPRLPIRVRMPGEVESRFYVGVNATTPKGEFNVEGFGKGSISVGQGVFLDTLKLLRPDGSYPEPMDPDRAKLEKRATIKVLDVNVDLSAVPVHNLASLDPDALVINFGRPGFVEDFRHPARLFLDGTQLRAAIDLEPLQSAANSEGQLQFWISLGKKGGGYVPLNPVDSTGRSDPGVNYELNASDTAPLTRRPRAAQ
jgi:hypothetical protein